jgi:hypothetical protein
MASTREKHALSLCSNFMTLRCYENGAGKTEETPDEYRLDLNETKTTSSGPFSTESQAVSEDKG